MKQTVRTIIVIGKIIEMIRMPCTKKKKKKMIFSKNHIFLNIDPENKNVQFLEICYFKKTVINK